MSSKYINTSILVLLYVLSTSTSYAVIETRATPLDSRIRVVQYNPNNVIKFIGYYGYQTCIEFEPGETPGTISLGDTSAWQISPSGNLIFLKPIEQDANTNMTVVTNKRMYFFELSAYDAIDVDDADLAFTVRFIYPNDTSNNNTSEIKKYIISENPELLEPQKLNYNYTISGEEDVAPIKIFDDGKFTYLKFRGSNADWPAIFSVDSSRHESIVNYRVSVQMKNTLIVEGVYPKLALRHNKKIVCVFNEGFDSYTNGLDDE